MSTCLRSKFSDPVLREKLLATGALELVDGHWGSPDLIWGYHVPSQEGENRLGRLLMELRSQLAASEGPKSTAQAVFQLDWPPKCLHAGLPKAYALRIRELAMACRLRGRLLVVPRRKICIVLSGSSEDLKAWEERMRTETVDVNQRGRPCKERMLVSLGAAAEVQGGDLELEEVSWKELEEVVGTSPLGPEPPELPELRWDAAAALLDGCKVPLCLDDQPALEVFEGLKEMEPRGAGEAVPLQGWKMGWGGGLLSIISASILSFSPLRRTSQHLWRPLLSANAQVAEPRGVSTACGPRGEGRLWPGRCAWSEPAGALCPACPGGRAAAGGRHPGAPGAAAAQGVSREAAAEGEPAAAPLEVARFHVTSGC